MAVASILMFAGAKTGYDPHSQTPAKSRHRYRAFRKKVAKFPGFLRGDTFRLILNLEGGSLEEVEDKVHRAYPFADGGYIGSNIRYSIPTTNITLSLADYVFSLVVISKPYGDEDPDDSNTKMTIELVRLHLKICASDGDGTVQIPKQAARLIVSQLEVKPHYLIRRAEHLAKKIPKKSLVDFVKYFWSKDPSTNPPYLTYDNTPSISFQ
ncbi:hypothetical protein DFQ27_008883 [Actinomortierella ambigua]|uniref:Uncharacterized protein n=1 Tax=Actinomortierella ambigua TaxID=1343610 RepID=A0A9P6QJN3_9FUNG|nr:hypothetical protein DFQ27_008883 [Actinomortierella ambigua]